ncbi:hypothetical protein DERF_001877 [Dermatophagoides farinae]|uniref:Uncharacterized protein n=1 Tax=Dermatophagoides farinae TaxID=6954 RepID=A0A922LA32_DERFA|nr:hypothetical protein DERF_001877 [Dermatophagoides farinae]
MLSQRMAEKSEFIRFEFVNLQFTIYRNKLWQIFCHNNNQMKLIDCNFQFKWINWIAKELKWKNLVTVPVQFDRFIN